MLVDIEETSFIISRLQEARLGREHASYDLSFLLLAIHEIWRLRLLLQPLFLFLELIVFILRIIFDLFHLVCERGASVLRMGNLVQVQTRLPGCFPLGHAYSSIDNSLIMLEPLKHACSFGWVLVLEGLPSNLNSTLFLELIVLRS